MRLHDIESAVLLPRFAHNAEWEQKALDQVVKGVRAKSFAMGAPYTREAISALSDAELQAFYFQYGIAIYYPDLSRETRENMLFELARVYRSLGTPHSVELLCEYIFDGADKVVVEIHDNLAFNAAGELVDDSLLDLFDVDLFPTSPTLSQDKIERIVENIFRFCRNSQTLRDIIIEFPDVAELPIASCDLEAFVYTIGGDEIAEEPQPVVVLPTVTISDKWLVLGAEAGSASGSDVTIAANATRAGCWWNGGSGAYIASVYDSSVVYAVVRAAKTPWAVVARAGLPVENVGGAIGVRNLTGAPITVYQAEYAYCDNLSSTVVTVYDSSLVPYNAFKFTAGGTDYYYVLDSVQTDWTDDLSSIGYNTSPYIDMLIGMKWNSDETALEAVTDFNYYWSRVITSEDKSTLNTLGLWADIAYKFGCLKYPLSRYSLTLLAVYYDMGITEGEASQFIINYYDSTSGNVAALYAPNHYTGTGIMTWKVRITKL